MKRLSSAKFFVVSAVFVTLCVGWKIRKDLTPARLPAVRDVLMSEASARRWNVGGFTSEPYEEPVSCEEQYGSVGRILDRVGVKMHNSHRFDQYEIFDGQITFIVRVGHMNGHLKTIFIDSFPPSQSKSALRDRLRVEYPEVIVAFFSRD